MAKLLTRKKIKNNPPKGRKKRLKSTVTAGSIIKYDKDGKKIGQWAHPGANLKLKSPSANRDITKSKGYQAGQKDAAEKAEKFEHFCKFFSDWKWSFDQWLTVAPLLYDPAIGRPDPIQLNQYVDHLHYLTRDKDAYQLGVIPLETFSDYVKGIVINKKKEGLSDHLMIGSHRIDLPDNIQSLYQDMMEDIWAQAPDAAPIPVHDFCIKNVPRWYTDQITSLVNQLTGIVSENDFGIVNVLRNWNLLDDYRLGNVIRLIAKTDHSQLEDDLVEAKSLIDDVLSEIKNIKVTGPQIMSDPKSPVRPYGNLSTSPF